jgi:hypothetical protein
MIAIASVVLGLIMVVGIFWLTRAVDKSNKDWDDET